MDIQFLDLSQGVGARLNVEQAERPYWRLYAKEMDDLDPCLP
jgi:hypothetical protein